MILIQRQTKSTLWIQKGFKNLLPYRLKYKINCFKSDSKFYRNSTKFYFEKTKSTQSLKFLDSLLRKWFKIG